MAPPEMDRLELSIRKLLEAHDAWRRRAREAEARIAELEESLRRMSTGGLNPLELADELRELQARNRRLEERLQQGSEAVQRMVARLQFAEEGR